MMEEAGACMIYETGDNYTGVYYAEGDVKFFSTGETVEECREDMLFTVNNLPENVHRIAEGEAELVDVMPLGYTEDV